MKNFALWLLLAAVTLVAPPAQAAGPLCHHSIHCPSCNKVCRAIPETIKIEKECWEVECEDICIPKIRFPWESCCGPPKCGKVITVRKLKKREYECEGCGYQWVIEKCPCGAGACAGAPYDAPPLEAPPAGVAPLPQPAQPVPPVPSVEPSASRSGIFGPSFVWPR